MALQSTFFDLASEDTTALAAPFPAGQTHAAAAARLCIHIALRGLRASLVASTGWLVISGPLWLGSPLGIGVDIPTLAQATNMYQNIALVVFLYVCLAQIATRLWRNPSLSFTLCLASACIAYWTLLFSLRFFFLGCSIPIYISVYIYYRYLLRRNATCPRPVPLSAPQTQRSTSLEATSLGASQQLGRALLVAAVGIFGFQFFWLPLFVSQSFFGRLLIRAFMLPLYFAFFSFLQQHMIHSFPSEVLPICTLQASCVAAAVSFLGRVMVLTVGSARQMILLLLVSGSLQIAVRTTFTWRHRIVRLVIKESRILSLCQRERSTAAPAGTEEPSVVQIPVGDGSSNKKLQTGETTYPIPKHVHPIQHFKREKCADESFHGVLTVEAWAIQRKSSSAMDDEESPQANGAAGKHSLSTPSLQLASDVGENVVHPLVSFGEKAKELAGQDRMKVLRGCQLYDEMVMDYATLLLAPVFLYVLHPLREYFVIDTIGSWGDVIIRIGIQLASSLLIDFITTWIEMKHLHLNPAATVPFRAVGYDVFYLSCALFAMHLALSMYILL